MVMFWIGILVVCVLVDLLTSNFLFIWIGFGAIAALVCEILGLSIPVQIIAGVIVSSISTAVGYPLSKKLLKKTVKKTLTQEENYIGQKFKAIEDITDEGKISLNGAYWRAKNIGEKIFKDEYFEVIDIQGNKIIIKKYV
ncbi:NfeD family protein [Clostridium cellulovorans]|uniref:NfeD-like C-terminal domain-containing protein n=1 Tax=Clostridium cellulovorans (strain ATCC 35296 / DSM 3052 / OCM 3 / 743B) TaxID=573061 RepID=D9SWY6_CLOC7|nr:NfeD family protein [Clostridium cellulovorans]ADL51347.1 protein of unknown function DUF107 [Clostridium cellulovorans 743B]